MIAYLKLWMLAAALLANPQARDARGKPVKPVMMPVPEAAWRPVTKAGPESGASSGASSSGTSRIVAVKRLASLAHVNGELRVAAIVRSEPGAESAESLLAAGANQLVFADLRAEESKPSEKYDFLTRACWFNGQGHPVRQILLLESRLTEPSAQAMETLLAGQRDFDVVGTARLMENPQLDGENLQLGDGHYGVIVVAPSDAWPEDTLDLLQEFITARGKVIFLGRQPLSIQRLLLRTGVVRVGEAIEDIDRALNYAITHDFHVTNASSGEATPMIRYQHRYDGRRHYFFVLNTDREHPVEIRMSIGALGNMEEWDLGTGVITPLRVPVKEIPAGGTLAVVVTPMPIAKPK